MLENPTRAIVKGSEGVLLHGARAAGLVPNEERFEVTVRVQRKMPLQSAAAEGFHSDQLPRKRQYLTHEQYTTAHGANPADLAKVEAFAQSHGLVVVETWA
jgi:kumamolisin